MAYQQRAARPAPTRQYGGQAADPAGYGQDPYSGSGGYGGQDYGYGDAGYDDGSYNYPSSTSSLQSQPRSTRGGYGPPPPGAPAPGYGRPPPRGYPGDRPPAQKRSRAPPGPRPPPGENFDNPFPSFPPTPQDRRGLPPRGPSLEKGMAQMDINGRGPPGRPPPGSRRPDMRAPPPRGPPPSASRGPPYGPPGRSGRSGPERSFTDPNGMPPPGRSATMPNRGPPMGPGGMYPGQASYMEPDYPSSPMGEVQPPRPSTASGTRPGRMDMGLMAPPPDPTHRVSYAPKEFLESYFEGGTPGEESDMPNFDAIPAGQQNGPIDEMGLEAPRSKAQIPASASGGQYSAYDPNSAASQPPRSKSQPNLRQNDAPNQFENAGFQFDIPSEAPPVPPQQENVGYQSPGGYPNGPPPLRTNQPAAMPEPQNPDALPSHPTPFRPGLDQKPAPVRQYTNAPTPAPAAPQPVPPDGTPAASTPVTHEELQRLQQQARGNPSDLKTQLLLAKKLVEAATVLVDDNSRLDPKMKARAKEKYILDAHKIIKKLASGGYSDAQFYLADCYGEGLLGLEPDPKEAFQLYQSAAKAGHAQSAYRVAVCCEIGAEEGGGTKRDPFKAVQWYKRAATLGDTPAMYKMGMIHLKGLLGQARSPREGISWLKRAAERADPENPHALHELALMYQSAGSNDIVIRDEEYASQLFHQAAELGYKFSQFRLGTAYEYGLMNCPVDNRMSIIWYTRAAAQGEHQSELALSGWYLTGSEGILQQNDTEAYLWARKAATAGLAKAEYAMGYFSEVGIGVQANLDDAKRWYWRAAAQGFPKARERLEDLKRGGRMQKTRLSRSAVNKQSDGDCVLM
ncbi:hypothetical protein N7474_002489 [Penicillium riverlandense]|uniref:uncharacterized protein n=1 Tax=Penicillium riverlandense TaxID=1903569 RepID=UPI0025487A02|nr:uncharacterized protein N7474_002489 [Penicillium riverlandense]KAJ5825351.1 hypothetical protein N7474_002489 [Penicillium riverlandense]